MTTRYSHRTARSAPASRQFPDACTAASLQGAVKASWPSALLAAAQRLEHPERGLDGGSAIGEQPRRVGLGELFR
jgi:hypothetical protein